LLIVFTLRTPILQVVGARALVFGVLVAALAASAAAASVGPVGLRGQRDGTFAVQDGRGAFQLQNMQGSVFGRVDRGRVAITNPYSNTGTTIVRGYQSIKIKTPTTTVYCCKNIRFRTSGKFTVRIEQGVGVELSVVGRGKGMLLGAGYTELGLSDGTYQLNDSPGVPVPDVRTWVTIKAPQPLPRPKRR
jgi:hypothetical protein